jgi:hypothetical protein
VRAAALAVTVSLKSWVNAIIHFYFDAAVRTLQLSRKSTA